VKTLQKITWNHKPTGPRIRGSAIYSENWVSVHG